LKNKDKRSFLGPKKSVPNLKESGNNKLSLGYQEVPIKKLQNWKNQTAMSVSNLSMSDKDVKKTLHSSMTSRVLH